MSNKLFIGVDIGGTTTKSALLTEKGTIISKWEIPTDYSNNGSFITLNIAKSIERELKKNNLLNYQVVGVGVGAPGPANINTGTIEHTPNLPWPDHYPLKEKLESEIGLPVLINNDANCAALGEMWIGAGVGSTDLVCVTLGTGIGGGVIVNGQVVQGTRGAAGEIGHLTVRPFDGLPCNCGKTGCLETIASATGIVRLALEQVNNTDHSKSELELIYSNCGKITAEDIFNLAKKSDPIAENIINEVCFYLGLALANVANTLNPSKIIIGGGVSRAGEILLTYVKSHFKQFAFSKVAQSTEIVLAKLGNDAGVIGAAWMIYNKM